MRHLQLLRTPSLILAPGAIHPLERKDAALLAMLAIDGPCAPAHAASMLWPDTEPTQARANLRQRLHRLRKLAGFDIVVSAKERLALAEGSTVDVRQFDQALATDPQTAGGDLLGNLDYGALEDLQAWVNGARERWRKQRSERLIERACTLEAANEIAAALVFAQRLASDDPLHEHNHRRVMRLHYLRGDRAGALAAYQHCCQTLKAQLGTTPHRETVQMAAVIDSRGALPRPHMQSPAPPMLTTLRPPRLCGRDVEWRLLEAARAKGTSVLIEGEAGIGKTRLLGDFAAAHGNAPMFGGRPGDAVLPYALLSRMVSGLSARFTASHADWVVAELSRIAPSLGSAAQGQLSELRLQQAMTHALTAWSGSGMKLLVVDDLHHADTATLELLAVLLCNESANGPTWLLGSRHAETSPEVQAWLDTGASCLPERLLLGPLDLQGVRLLLESLSLSDADIVHWAAALLRHTGGNPLFILETFSAALRGQADGKASVSTDASSGLPIPERIGRLVSRRLQLLTPAALKLARLAAIAGQDFSVALAGQVLQLHALDIADSWNELEAAHVIDGEGFSHDLILESALQSIPAVIARQLHRDVALFLQTTQALPGRLAGHWTAAEEWGLAGDAFIEASKAARAASRNVEAAALDDEAVRCFTQAGETDKAFNARRDSIANALLTSNAEQVLALTQDLLSAARNATQRLDALIANARALVFAGNRLAATSVADEAMTLAQTMSDPWQKFEAAACCALCMSPGPRAAEAIQRLQAFQTLIEAAGDGKRTLLYHSMLAGALREDFQLLAALKEGELALVAAQKEHETPTEQTLLANQSVVLRQLGRTERGLALAGQACRLIEIGRSPSGLAPASARFHLALLNGLAGRLDLALQGLEQAWRDIGEQGGTLHHAVCEIHLANLWLQLGQPARALQTLVPAPEALITHLPFEYARRLMIEERIERYLNRSPSNRLTRAIELLTPLKQPVILMGALLDQGRAAAPGEALAVCKRVEQQARTMELLATAMRARALRVEALLRGGQTTEAAELARTVLTSTGDCQPGDLYWPEVLWIAYQALRGAHDEAAAAAVLKQAVEWIRQRALPHLAEPLREAFLHRNPINLAILGADSRQRGA